MARAITACAAALTLRASMFTWPNARISVMGGEQAASVLATVKRDGMEARGEAWSPEEEESFKSPIRDQYDVEGHPYFATARLWDDGIIAPQDSRRVLGLALSATLNAPVLETRNSASSGCNSPATPAHISSIGQEKRGFAYYLGGFWRCLTVGF